MTGDTAGTLISSTSTGQVRRPWCVWLSVALVLLGVISNTIYLFHNCPIDLSEDESHYWEWSRHLDYGYYSKPPGIAWVIWGALKVGGMLGLTRDGSGAALMPVMREAAVVFGCCSGLLSLFLARRIFRDDRAALAVTVLSAAVPMFAVGSLLITIDSPMYLCWAATVYCLWRAVEASGENSKLATQNSKRAGLAWLYLAGLACAVGMLFKPVLIAIPLCVLVGTAADEGLRRAFKNVHALLAGMLILLSQVPVVIWNWQHHWVTFRHILTQGGFGRQGGEAPKTAWYAPLARIGEYLGGQAGGMGGIMFVLLVIAVIVAWQKTRRRSAATVLGTSGEARTRWVFLLSFTLPLWGFYFVMNFWKRTEVNWPAASYFTGMILLAGIFVEGWNETLAKVRRNWRTWGTIAVVWGFMLTMLAMNTQRLYPLVAPKLEDKKGTPAYSKSLWNPMKWDQPTVRLRGLQDRAAIVEKARQKLAAETGVEPLLITARYDTSSSLSFYMPGHPFVYSLMSSVGGRQSQYDVWPGLNQETPDGDLAFEGRAALIVGSFEPWAVEDILKQSFDRLEGPETFTTQFDGILLKDLYIFRGYGFRGVPANASSVY